MTLTYSDDTIPPGATLHYPDFKNFIRRTTKAKGKTRFYMCGEYGAQDWRPHYHALLFGIHFNDQYPWQKSETGEQLYRSPELEQLWPLGHSLIGAVTFQSAAYVARYVMKKITGDAAQFHYPHYLDEETGEIKMVRQEFTHMSLKPGIAAGWLEKFHDDVYPEGEVVANGRKQTAPDYYHRIKARTHPELIEKIKKDKQWDAQAMGLSRQEHLDATAKITEAKLSFLRRQ